VPARRARLHALLLAAACAAAYANSFGVPFLFDDLDSIIANARLRSLWPIHETVATPRQETTLSARPVSAYTFALNHAVSGLSTWSYHAVNVAVHAAAALLLHALLRRAFQRARPRSLAPEGLAFAAALTWALHPLHTESVTYVVQRVESLAGATMLAVLLCVVRGHSSPRPRAWYAAAVALCALGMGVKEVVAVTPLVVLLLDRALLAGSFRAALRARWGLHVGLAACWGVLAPLLAASPRARMAEQAAAELGRLEYLRIQCWAVVRYLRLAFWPTELTFDYGGPLFGARFAASWPAVGARAALVVALALAALLAAWRRPRLGLPAAGFFLWLAPSSSVVPLPLETVAEHRTYVPLAALVVLCALAADRLVARLGRRDPAPGGGALLLWCLPALALGTATVARNQVYRDELALWRDTVAKRPDNARALTQLGKAEADAGDVTSAMARFHAALEVQPAYAPAHVNLGILLARADETEQALAAWYRAIEVDPRAWRAYELAAEVLLTSGDPEDVAGLVRSGLALEPGYAPLRLTLARALLQLGDPSGALRESRRAAAGLPDDPRPSNLAGRALLALGQAAEAAAEFRRALAIQPDFAPAADNLRAAEEEQRRTGERP
jgi:tetratricopeptide (TPR) repeat protein